MPIAQWPDASNSRASSTSRASDFRRHHLRRATGRKFFASDVACLETTLGSSTDEKANAFRSAVAARFRKSNERSVWLAGGLTRSALCRHYNHSEEDGTPDHPSQPRLSVPGKSEKPLVIEEVISENSDGQKMPGKG